MDKNATEDTKAFFFGGGSTIMSLLITIILAWITNEITGVNPFIAFFLSLILVAISVQIVNEVRWTIRRKNGFVNVETFSDSGFNEHEKLAWLKLSSKNETEKIKLHIIIRRAINGREISLSNLAFIGNGVFVAKDIVLEDYPQKISIMSVAEDYGYLLTEDKKVSLRILLDGENNFSQELCEIFFEIKGKIDDKYIFSEFYKGVIVYRCSSEPNILVGQEETSYRSSDIKWQSLEKWSLEEENKRPLLREIRNYADKMF